MILPAFLLTPLFKIGATAAVALVLVGSCMLRDSKLEKQGAAKVVAAAKEASKENAEKSRKAHEKARAPGAADRLLRDACRDCR